MIEANKSLGDDEQQEQRAEYGCGDDHAQRYERCYAGIACNKRHHDQERHQQAQRVGPGRGNEGVAAVLLDASQPDDEVKQERRRYRREQGVGGDGDDERCEQGLVHDLQDDQEPKRARRPDQMIVKARRGFVVFLHQTAMGVLRRKQPARHPMTECGRRHAGDNPLSDLLETHGQQTERCQCKQSCEAGKRHADREPGEHPQRGPGLGRSRIRRLSDEPRKPPSRQCKRERDDNDDNESGGCPTRAGMMFAPSIKQRFDAAQLDRQGAVNVGPEGRIEYAGAAREQLVGVQRVAFLGDAITQLAGPNDENASLFQLAVDIVELLREFLALAGDLRAFGGGVLGWRGTQLLQPVASLLSAWLEPVDFLPQDVRRRIEGVAEAGEGFRRYVLAVDRGLDLVQ